MSLTKVIRVPGATLDPYAPKIIRTPGVPGYTSRFIASHLRLPDGSTVTEWPSVAGTTPVTLKPLSGATASTLTLHKVDGVAHVRSRGDSATGGRLLGPNINSRPFALAGVFRAETLGVETFAGLGGATFTRNASGTGYYNTVGGAYSLVQKDGWVFLLITMGADGSFVFRADNFEVAKPAGTVGFNPSHNGPYFGATAAGDVSDVREMIVWDRPLDLAERTAIHDYFRGQYPGLG